MAIALVVSRENQSHDSTPHTTCRKGHALEPLRVRPGDRGCDLCACEINEDIAYHCEACDFDMCRVCHFSVVPRSREQTLLPPSPSVPPLIPLARTPSLSAPWDAVRSEIVDENSSPRGRLSVVLQELERLSQQHAELETAQNEETATTAGAIALREANLVRTHLQETLRRYRERQPSVEEIVQKYEAEIDALTSEAERLHDERAALVLVGADDVPETLRSPKRETQQLRDEVRERWRRQALASRRQRCARMDEWRLSKLRNEMQAATRAACSRERCAAETRRQCSQANAVLRELAEDHKRGQEEIESERRGLAALHKDALALRQACLVPAQLKCKSAVLVQALDQEGGRLASQQRANGLQVAAKLQRSVAAHAPTLQLLAGRAMAAMDKEFVRYQRLEQSHAQLLQRVHHAVMRGALS